VSKGSRQNGSVPSVKRLALTVRFFGAQSETSFGVCREAKWLVPQGNTAKWKSTNLVSVHSAADIGLASKISYEG
jgi:hypothetical protein